MPVRQRTPLEQGHSNSNSNSSNNKNSEQVKSKGLRKRNTAGRMHRRRIIINKDNDMERNCDDDHHNNGNNEDDSDKHKGSLTPAVRRKVTYLVAAVVSSVFLIVIPISLHRERDDAAALAAANKNLTDSLRLSNSSSSISSTSPPTQAPAPKITKMGTFEVLETLPHDPSAFTQGLQLKDDIFFESTGMYFRSDVRKVNATTGEVIERHKLESRYFAEGLTLYNTNSSCCSPNGESVERLVQITWQEKTGFVYNPEDLSLIHTFSYTTTSGEGWGITYNPVTQILYVSDGTEYLHLWDANTLKEISKVPVTMQRVEMTSPATVPRLNELEWDPSTKTVLANVWFQNVILRIDPESGFVTTVYDFTSLYVNRAADADVFNGIALIPEDPTTLWVTGKLWPYMYRVRLIEPVAKHRLR